MGSSRADCAVRKKLSLELRHSMGRVPERSGNTFLLPHFEPTSLRFGTSTKIMSFQSFNSSNVFTA